MAKNTHSQEILTGTSDSYTAEEMTDPMLMLRNRPQLGGTVQVEETQDGEPEVIERGDEPSVGNNSTQSSESASTVSGSESHVPQALAQTTDSPSNRSGEESSTAPMTVGSGRETAAQQSAKKAAPQRSSKSTARASRSTSKSDDDFDF